MGLAAILMSVTASLAGGGGGGQVRALAVLDGSKHQIQKDSSVTVEDSAFFNPAYAGQLNKSYSVQNAVTLMINEASTLYMRTKFSATVRLLITWSDSSGNSDTATRSFTVGYDSAGTYNSRSSFAFQGAHKVTVKVVSDSTNATGWDPTTVLLVENQLTTRPAFLFNCQTTISNITVSPSADTASDELPVSWNAIPGAGQYDLEWTYIDDSAFADNRYGAPPYNPALIFRNNSTRVTVTGTSYNIPIIYDDYGTLFIRVRPTQLGNAGAVTAAIWSTDASPAVMGVYKYNGHERPLNWQSNISYAEEGKRKVVLQYYDGSLRSRQTVTKDNTTNTTIVGETYYDYQGRPAIQVMPSPTLSNTIKYTAGFNVSFNSPEYSQSNYDTLPNPGAYCDIHADSMNSTTGASQYYSPNNPQANLGLNQFIPDAQNYPFTETEYTPDNTGRINRQGGVGRYHQLGTGHETKYFYGTPDQNELDALFGTDVGDKAHYFKNMVRDANGQYSVSYVDMHGRTIATALSGVQPLNMTSLASNNSKTITETLADSGSASIQDQSMVSQKSLLVSKADTFNFRYNFLPDSLQEPNCQQQNICYTCRYDLDITITDNCNNQLLGGQPFTISRHNFSLATLANSCVDTAMNLSFSLLLPEGSFMVTKKLTVNRDAYDYYRDSIYLPNNTCTTLSQFVTQQKAVIASKTTTCSQSCATCMGAIGTWASFLASYNQSIGLPATDTTYQQDANAAYQSAIADCASVCNTNTDADDIRSAMLTDMTPPYGQYADSSQAPGFDKYSIFFIGKNDTAYVPVYQLPQIVYLDVNGRPDSVYNAESGLMEAPNTLSKENFVANFRPSWANALLLYHPEYCRLQALQDNNSSLLWDRKMQSDDTYAQALADGFLNPTNLTGTPFGSNTANPDPLAVSNSSIANSLNSQLKNYAKAQGIPNFSMSMWGLAVETVKCSGATDATCALNYKTPSYGFDDPTMCDGDKDMAWRSFRQLYQQAKQDLFLKSSIITNPSNCHPANSRQYTSEPKISDLVSSNHISHFTDVTTLLKEPQGPLNYIDNISGPTAANNAQAAAMDSLNVFYTANCAAFAQEWLQQLTSSCTVYNSTDVNNTLIPALVSLCRTSCDGDHPYGASTLPPGVAPIPFLGKNCSSFQDVINAYNQSRGITDLVHCNAELITSPLPYDNQPVYSAKPVYSRPSDCECSLINDLYVRYTLTRQGDVNFSAYLLRTQQITMSETDLDNLRNMCANTTNSLSCKNLTQPVYLPPVMQCHTGETCSSCQTIDSLFTSYKAAYPGILPSDTSDIDTAQSIKNQLFQNYMNNRLGYNLQFWQYLQFMDSCKHVTNTAGTVSCDSTLIAQTFNSGGTDVTTDIKSTSDGGYVLTGYSKAIGAAFPSAHLMRYNSAGAIQWSKTYTSTDYSDLVKVRVTSDGGFVAVGTVYSTPNPNTSGKLFVVRTSGAGDTVWQKSIGFNSTRGELGQGIIQTRDGGFAIVGDHDLTQLHVGPSTILVTKLDSLGNIVWANAVGNTTGNDGYGLTESPTGDTLYVVGRQGGAAHGVQGVLLKIRQSTGASYSSLVINDNTLGFQIGSVDITGNSLRLYNYASIKGQGDSGRIGVMDMTLDGKISNSVRVELPPGNITGDSSVDIVATAAVRPTADGGWLIGETGEITPNIYWVKMDASGHESYSRMSKLSGLQTIGGLIQNPDASFTALGTNSNVAMLLNLSSSAAAGCYDSLVTVNVYVPTLIVSTVSQSFSSLTTGPSGAALPENLGSINTTRINCAGSTNCYVIYNPPFLCGKATPLFTPSADSITACSDSLFFAVGTGTSLYNNYSDSLTGDFEQRYLAKCMQAYRHETFTVTHRESEYHYTLYYYDQAGNLLKTVPPAGVQQNTDSVWLSQVRAARAAGTVKVPAHTLLTNYRYNTLNQVMSQRTPDGGGSSFWYDRLGRLAISQNARQKPNSQYSYTQYDTIGRIIQVGQLVSSTGISDAISRVEASLLQWENNGLPSADQITVTTYDAANSMISDEIVQRNVRNRVAWTGLFNTSADLANGSPNAAAATYYSYDILGNVDTLIQDYGSSTLHPDVSNPMNTTGNRFKKVVYDFDLVSGKVNQVTYQHGYVDAFYHSYLYDAENRITNVQSSTDSINWDNDAFYSYYAHGPLARTVLGQQQVQGVNYAYTLQGWLKSINPAPYTGGTFTLRPDSTNNIVANNAYSLLLDYFDGDFKPVSPAAGPDNGVSTTLGAAYRPLYNGNISSMGVSINKAGNPMLYNYQYDQLNRLVHMDAWKRTATAWSALTSTTDYQENVAYDPNGNINTYSRNAYASGLPGASGNSMDKLHYAYTPGTNKLDHITDTVPGSVYNDISTQDTLNYKYDSIGELIADKASNITGITWTVYGKIASITKTNDTTIKYTYDAAGSRISKSLTHAGQTETTWYARDAQGNILSVYTNGDAAVNGGNLAQTELDIYGSSRLGIWKRMVDVQGKPIDNGVHMTGLADSGYSFNFSRGNKLFELTNHLGNVLAAISDKRYGVSADDSTVTYYNPEIVSANDYYPFGMMQPGRSYTEANVGNYRYGFNGKENDNEVKGLGNQIDYGNRIYDPRIARWSSLDPSQSKYPSEAPYAYVSGNPIIYTDPEGNEKVITITTHHKDGRITVIRKTDPDYFVHRSVWIDRSAAVGLPWLGFLGTKENVYENYTLDENTPNVIKSEVSTKVEETFGNPVQYGTDLLKGDQSGNEKYGYILFASAHDMENNKGNEKAAPGSEILDIDNLISALQSVRDIPTEVYSNPDIKDFISDRQAKKIFDGADNFLKFLDNIATANGGNLPFGPKDIPEDSKGDLKPNTPKPPQSKHIIINLPAKPGSEATTNTWVHAPYGSTTDTQFRQEIYVPKPKNEK
jgi:RHS repeat-associated protein